MAAERVEHTNDLQSFDTMSISLPLSQHCTPWNYSRQELNVIIFSDTCHRHLELQILIGRDSLLEEDAQLLAPVVKCQMSFHPLPRGARSFHSRCAVL